MQACVARHFLDLAGLSRRAEVWTGQFRDLLARLGEEFGPRSVGFIFLDYKGTAFHADLAELERLRAPAPAARTLADNVVLPGAPLYLWRMTRHPAWETKVWAMEEFLEPGVEDWLCLSALLLPPSPETPSAAAAAAIEPAPRGWRRLAWHTDHMRRRAQGLRPGEMGMEAADRSEYAAVVRATYRAGGVEAIPWQGAPPQRMRRECRRAENVSTPAWPVWGGRPGGT